MLGLSLSSLDMGFCEQGTWGIRESQYSSPRPGIGLSPYLALRVLH